MRNSPAKGHIISGLLVYWLGALVATAQPIAQNDSPRGEADFLKKTKLAAEKGDAEAQWKLGGFYLIGDYDLPQNPEEAVKWFRKSAEQGHPGAQFELGRCYTMTDSSNGVPYDLENAAKFFEKAARQGHVGAQYSIGICYNNGEGLPQNKAQAVHWFRKAADQGHADAQYDLGALYAKGEGVERDPVEAVKWFKKAADQGESFAQYNLAACYQSGRGVSRDLEQAFEWYRKSAEQGHSLAQIDLGICYAEGKGIAKNPEKAAEWFQAAAQQGEHAARNNLGYCYETGFGVEKDLEKAAELYRFAALAGNPLAQRNLGRLFETGQGVGLDKNKAIYWYGLSADQGDRESLSRLKKMGSDHLSMPRIALLIANGSYSNFGGELANAIPDAEKLNTVLRALGFQVMVVKNADREGMQDAIQSFEQKIRGTNALAFFHYGGHGVQVDGENYLLPADADIPDQRRVATRAVNLDEVIGALEAAGPSASIVVVDACRDNPLPAGERSATRGLAAVGRKPKNSLIIFAAEPGCKADDGLFTPILANTILSYPDLSIGQIMLKVRAKVIDQSDGSQTPGEYSQLVEEVFLKPKP